MARTRESTMQRGGRTGGGAGRPPSCRPHHRHGRHDGRREILDRPAAGGPPRPPLRRRRQPRSSRRPTPRSPRSSRPTARPISATASGASSSGFSTARRRCLRPAAAPSSTPRRGQRSGAAGVSVWLKADRELILHARQAPLQPAAPQDRRSRGRRSTACSPSGTRSMPRPISTCSRATSPMTS